MNSDMMEEVLGNPEKMEQARQAILENPTLKQAMAQLPGFADMVSATRDERQDIVWAVKRAVVISSLALPTLPFGDGKRIPSTIP